MQVSDEMVDGLRALCVGDLETFKAISAAMDPRAAATANAMLLAAAFMLALERRFEDSSDFDVMRFVAEKRSISDRIAGYVDPEEAESVIRHGLGWIDHIDLDNNARYRIQLAILMWLLAEFRMEESEVDAFVGRARRIAEKMVVKQAERKGSL